MRYQGKITHWKDDQGFGFITRNGGGNQVFVHIKSFVNRQRRPVGNEIVTYELKTDAKGRAQAGSVAFIGEQVPMATLSKRSNVSLILAPAIFSLLTAAVITGKLPFAVLALYLFFSVVAFISYTLDKLAAGRDQRRTPENTLHLFALAGGWPGALVAQKLLNHKIKKQSFQIVFWVTVILNCGALGWLFSSAGAEALHSILGAS